MGVIQDLQSSARDLGAGAEWVSSAATAVVGATVRLMHRFFDR
jgi:hypothetical protein